MHTLSKLKTKSFQLSGLGAALALSLVVACGTATTATPPLTSAPTSGTTVVATGPTATVAPMPTSAPTGLVVNPGKLTIMVGDLLSERFDNALVTGNATNNYIRTLHGFLISDNERKEMVPGIASQWGLSADGLTWTFTIRKGVKWHDGSELTPADALWTLRHQIGPEVVESSLSSMAVVARKMEKIELSGPDKVSLTTKLPVTELAILVSETGPSGWPVMPKRAKLRDTEEEVAYDRNPVGAGPMKLVQHVPVSVMRFERFDDFYYQPKNGFPEDKRVKFQSLDLFLAPEEATRVAAVRAGEADIVSASLPAKQQVEAGGGRLVLGPEGLYVDVRLDGCWQPQYPCHDKRVRQALDYAIDKELIRDRLYGGPEVFQVKGFSFFTPSTIGYSPELAPWPFDPAKARQLLADAGYPGGQGFGKLIVNTYISTSMPFQVELAQLGADFWRKGLGLDVEVRVLDSVGISSRQRAGELNGQIRWVDNQTRIDATSWINLTYGDFASTSRFHEDPDLLRLVQETMQILDPDKRAEATKKLALRLRDESYELGIGYVNIPWAVGPRVLTWRPYPLSLWVSALHTVTLK